MFSDDERRLRKNERNRAYYQSHKNEMRERTNRNRRKRKESAAYRQSERMKRRERRLQDKAQARKLILAAKSAGCIYCGEIDPVAIDFHHRDPGVKHSKISDWSRFTTFQKLAQEIAKCDPICSNCHRKLHAARKLRVTSNASVGHSST